MPWIENVAAADIPTRFHHEAGENSMLISIIDDLASWRPTPAHKFKEQHNFEFLDVEEKDSVLEESMKCSHEDAARLVALLQHALDNRMNVAKSMNEFVVIKGKDFEVCGIFGVDEVTDPTYDGWISRKQGV
jgi:hypothetical protein